MNQLSYYKQRAKYYDLIHYHLFDIQIEIKFLEWLFKKFNKKVKTILDVACGTGRVSIPLSERGYQVMGIDAVKEMLLQARKKIKSSNKNICFKKADMKEFISNKKFDCAICLGPSFSHVNSKDEQLKILSNIYKSLKKNGIFVFNDWNILGWPKLKLKIKRINRIENTKATIIWDEWIDSIKCFYNWKSVAKIKENGKIITLVNSSKMKIWKYEEWLDMLKETGFNNIKCFASSKDRKEIKGNSEVFYFVAIK